MVPLFGLLLFVSLDERPDALDQHADGHGVETSFRNDYIRIFFRRFDELLMHRLHRCGVLRDDGLHGPSAIADVAQDTSSQAEVGTRTA